MTRGMHPPERARSSERDQFDPVVEGARHGLSPGLSRSLWEQVRADATDSVGRCDLEQARRQFRQLAARIGARGGRRKADVGRVTRVSVEITGDPRVPPILDEERSRRPGRETLVAVEARRWAAPDDASIVR
jgi:hypothetical protein